MYGLAAVVVLVVATQADWPKIQKNFFNTDMGGRHVPRGDHLGGQGTALYATLSFVLGMVLALALALMRLSSLKPFRAFAIAYTNCSRASRDPLLFVGFGLPIAFSGFRIPGGVLGGGSVGLALVAGAYMAETIRAGIEAVPKGQTGRPDVGMSNPNDVHHYLPQAFRIIIPPLTNELVLLIKDTSLFFILGSTPGTKELTGARDFMNAERSAAPLTVVAVLYLLITLPLTFLVRRLERSAAKAR